MALASHRKAVASAAGNRFSAEIVPLKAADGTTVDSDECPRPDTSLERLASLPPVFDPQGTVTAGNACPVNDGAAAVVVMSEEKMRALGIGQGLRVVDSATRGVDPNLLGIGPVPAVQALLARQSGLAIDDIDLIEFNEAFAAQVLACLDALSIDQARVNVGGGALALGHPFGASGAILVVRLFSEMVRTPTVGSPRLGLATLGIGGGMGIATLFERI